VYKRSKALYGLNQAPWAWYARHGYIMGSVDKTIFTLNHGTDFLLVQIYVDDIIFGGSSHSLVYSFQRMMDLKFQMSMMGQLTFFLGIQVKQTKQGIFVHQAKYTNDLMKFNMAELKPVSTLMSMATSLGPLEDGEVVDQREYRSMIASLLYLMATQPNIQSAACLCVHFQASPCSLHQMAIQWIFRYLKHTLKFGIWYSASFSLDLVGFSDVDFAGCGIDRKSTSGTCHFLGSSQKQSSVAQSTVKAEYVAATSCCS
jgi:hypothetical protein